MTVDPVASLRIWAVELELAGRVFQIPPLPAADWLPVLIEGDLFAIMEMVPDSSNVDELILSGEVTAEQLTTALTAVIEQVTGRPLHAAIITAQLTQHMWPVIGGELAVSGFRWDQQPIGAALDAIRYVVIRSLARSKETLDTAKKIEAMIDKEVSTIDRSKALDDFETMAGPRPTGAVPAGVPATGGRSAGNTPRSRPRRGLPRPAGRSPVPTTRPG